jgi:hypothetical protein
MLRPISKHCVANTFSMLRTTLSMLRTLFPCCAPLPPAPTYCTCCERCYELVESMLQACGQHVATTIQTSDARLMDSWEGVRFSPVGRLIRSITDIILPSSICLSLVGIKIRSTRYFSLLKQGETRKRSETAPRRLLATREAKP